VGSASHRENSKADATFLTMDVLTFCIPSQIQMKSFFIFSVATATALNHEEKEQHVSFCGGYPNFTISDIH
jgi:hypothetical protein